MSGSFDGLGPRRSNDFDLWTFPEEPRPEEPTRRVGFRGEPFQENKAYFEANQSFTPPAPKPVEPNYNNVFNTVLGVVNIVTENILIHPFVVLRRQCQVGSNLVLQIINEHYLFFRSVGRQ